jgi:hypothetical protein
MARAGDVAYRLRWLLLGAGVLLFAAGTTYIFVGAFREQVWGLNGTPALLYVFENAAWVDLAQCAVFLGVFLLTQWLFLRPRGTWDASLREEGRPLLAASIGAAFCASGSAPGAATT